MRPLWVSIPGWLLALVIVVGNGLAIFLITMRRNLRTTTNWFVLSLAVADFGVGAILFPCMQFCNLREKRCLNEAAHIAFLMGTSFPYASVMNLCALTLDRYLAIVHPLRYVTCMTKKRVALLILAAWSVAASVSVSRVLSFVVLSENSQQIMGNIILLWRIVLGVFTCLYLLFATVRIFGVVRRIARQNAAVVAQLNFNQLNFNHRLQKEVGFKTRETASAKMIGIVVTVCLVYYLWYVANSIVLVAVSQSKQVVVELGNILVLINSAVNPGAYFFYKREIKTEVKRLLRCNRQQDLCNFNSGLGQQMETHELKPYRNQVERHSGL